MPDLLQWLRNPQWQEPLVKTIQIRRIDQRDSLDELTSMLHRAFSGLGRMGLRCTCVDQSIDVTARRVRRGDCYVARAGGRIVGTMTLEAPVRGSACHWYRRPEVASLHQFAVDPCEQGRGFGKALLLFASQRARAQGYCELALDTPADASHLIALYLRQGFRIVETMRKPAKDYRSIVLSKTIARAQRALSPWHSPHRVAWCGALVQG
jgi:GNAT superfamily N-acetyltransferase